MIDDMQNKSNKQGFNLKRYVFAALGVLLIVLLIFSGEFLNSEPAPSEFQTDELQIPEELKEQGEPELTRLNPDPQVKDGW